MQDNGQKKEMTDISDEMKEAGFVYRPPNKDDPKYKECEKILKDSWRMDAEGKLWIAPK